MKTKCINSQLKNLEKNNKTNLMKVKTKKLIKTKANLMSQEMKTQQAFKQVKIFICAKTKKIRKYLVVLIKQKRAHKML